MSGSPVVKNHPLRPHISFSQMSMYLRCSMQYYFRYMLGLKDRPSLPLSIGKGGHSALESNGRYKIKHGSDMNTEDLLDLASDFITHETDNLETSDLRGDDPGEAKDRALASIRIFRTRDAINITPAGVEVDFNLDLNEPNEEPIRIIKGKIDLIDTSNGIEDYKFAGKMKSQPDVDLSPQLTLYGKVFHTLTGRYPSRTGFRVFTPGSTRTTPDSRIIDRDAILMTPAAQESRFKRLAFQLRQVERGIAASIFIPTDDPRTCSWCGFRDRCQSSLVTDMEAAVIRGEI